MEITVFWEDTRMLTSIVNANGERQINTQASAEVVDRVLKKGETYQNRGVEILGTKYIVCYTPIYQENSDEIVGMVFLGTPQETVSAIINKVRLQFLAIILCIVIIAAIVSYILVKRIISALKNNMNILDKIANGFLHIDMEQSILKRKDEIGDLGKNIFHLKDSLRTIVKNIHTKSHDLENEAADTESISQNVYQVMNEVNNSTREMTASCSKQAEDASQASANVTSMGDMIENNTLQLNQLHEISGDMKDVSIEAIAQFEQNLSLCQNAFIRTDIDNFPQHKPCTFIIRNQSALHCHRQFLNQRCIYIFSLYGMQTAFF